MNLLPDEILETIDMDIVDGLNDRQKEALLETEGPVLVIAGAGSRQD